MSEKNFVSTGNLGFRNLNQNLILNRVSENEEDKKKRVSIISKKPDPGSPPPQKQWNRIAQLRKEERLTLETCAKRMGISLDEARQQEDPCADLTMSQIEAWSNVLNVNYQLIFQTEQPIDPIADRAFLLRLTKSIAQLLEQVSQEPFSIKKIRFIAQSLDGQRREYLPEYDDITPWPEYGKSHEDKDNGVAAYRRFDSSVLRVFDRDDSL